MNSNKYKKWKGKTGQEIQDEIFRKMSADKKISLASGLTKFCLELSILNGDHRSKKVSRSNSVYSR